MSEPMAATETTPSWVGRGITRVEDDPLLRGREWFIDDIDPLPHAGHAAIVRSPFAHAQIRSIDVSAALAVDGVIGVVTGAEVAAITQPFPSVLDVPIDYRPAAYECVRFAGEPVAVVVARDRYVAEDAAALVVVDYDPQPVVADPASAAEPTAIRLHAATTSNVVSDRVFRYGDPEQAFATAALVVRRRFRHPRNSATPVETYGVIANWDESRGGVDAWANFQGPFTLHGVAAAALGIPASKLRLCTPSASGGSYGIKSAVFVYVVLMAAVSRVLGIPVRWTEDRGEHLLASSSATERLTEIAAGFDAAGKLVALDLDLLDDVGAYVRAPEPATLYRMHGCLTGAYDVQNLAVRSRVVVTNRAPTGLNRGFGGPQLYYPLERTMMIAAGELGLDHAELIRRNLVRSEQMPYRAAAGAVYDSGDYLRCFDEALELADYHELVAFRDEKRAQGRLVGIGLAVVVEPSVSNMGYISLAQPADVRAKGLPKTGNSEGVSIAMGPHGGVTVRFTSTPQGQGHRTVAAQIVADALGVPLEDIDVRTEADTSANPWTVSSGNYSSRFSAVVASAIHQAATLLADRLRTLAAGELGCEPEAVVLSGGKARCADDPERTVSLRRLAGGAHWNPAGTGAVGDVGGLALTATYTIPLPEPDADDRCNTSAVYGFIADVAIVEVDAETGQVQVLRYATVHDAGRILNPLIADGQMMGGLAHGLGAALLEEHRYDEDGNLMTASFLDYLPPTATELPPVRHRAIETPSPTTPLGAKGLGEGNTMSAPACLANAVADAIGVDAVPIPLTPARVWALLQGEAE